jgi:signal transduction histidine kinase
LTLATKLLGEEADEEQRLEMGVVCSRMLSDMTRILNDVLDYSAIIAGHSQLTVERFSLRELFEEIIAQWKPVVEEQGLEFENKCDSALGEIVSDKLKLKQIAGNLLSNAVKYRKPSRGGHVGISFAVSGEKSWKMVVADTGIGIAPADMEVLFGKFSRVQSTSAVTGTGLGLAICKEFAELLGGHVEVRSEAQQGTRFEVTLPMSAEMPGR